MLYDNVPQGHELEHFRETHPISTANINGREWEYISSGQGEQVVLLLVGGLRVADAAFRSIPMLEDQFRVITPTYPAADTMAELADGLAGILDAENIESASVLAGSFGGMLAQVYVRRHPQRVEKLILSTTAVLDEDGLQRYRQGLQMLEHMSPGDAANAAQQIMFTIIAPPEDMQDFYRAYLNELYTVYTTKDELLSIYRCLIDFGENYTLSPDDWTGDTLILESDDDATFDESTREAVHALYPQAKIHVFHGAGHSPGTTQRDLYFQVVKDYLST